MNISFFTHKITNNAVYNLIFDIFEYISENYPNINIYLCSFEISDSVKKNELDKLNINLILFDENIQGYINMYKWFKIKNIDVLHSHLINGAFFSSIISKFAGVSKIVTTYHSEHKNKTTFKQKLALLFISLFVDKFVSVSENVSESFFWYENLIIKLLEKNKITIDNFVNLKEIDEIVNLNKSMNYSDSNTLNIVTVGRLIKLKNHCIIIEAMNKIKKKNIKLKIIGDGEKKEELIKLVYKYNLENDVEFLGEIERDEVIKIISLQDVFILPSLTEGLSLALLEAMACGLPVIGSNISSIKKIIKEGNNGFLFDPYNSDQLKNEILKFYDGINKDVKLINKISLNNRNLVKLKYDTKNIEKYINIYKY